MVKFGSLIVVTVVFTLVAMGILGAVHAATLNNVELQLADPQVNKISQYNIKVSSQSAALIRCITVRFTDDLGANSPISGVDLSGSSLDASSTFIPNPGLWTLSASNATGTITLTNAAGENPVGGSNRTLSLNGIKNGNTPSTNYWGEVKSYSDLSCTSPVDDGVGVFLYTWGITISTFVPEELNLSLGPSSCSFGALSIAVVKTCSIGITAQSNSTNGYSLSYVASTTLTKVAPAADTVAHIGASPMASAPGTEQFGFNLVANTNPPVGANPSGGSAMPSANYSTPNLFAFIPGGETIATSNSPSAATSFTASYIANISNSTISGNYTATQTFILTANP